MNHEWHNGHPGHAYGPPGFAIQPSLGYGAPMQAASVEHSVPPKPNPPRMEQMTESAVAPSLVILSGITRDMPEQNLALMVVNDNPGFLSVFVYTSCPCKLCSSPETHQKSCICLPCLEPFVHTSWAVFQFKNAIAAEYGWWLIRWQVMRTLNDLSWEPGILTIQHPNQAAILSREQRDWLLRADQSSGAPPPPALPQPEKEEYVPRIWANSSHAKKWQQLVEAGEISTKRKRESSSDDEAEDEAPEEGMEAAEDDQNITTEGAHSEQTGNTGLQLPVDQIEGSATSNAPSNNPMIPADGTENTPAEANTGLDQNPGLEARESIQTRVGVVNGIGNVETPGATKLENGQHSRQGTPDNVPKRTAGAAPKAPPENNVIYILSKDGSSVKKVVRDSPSSQPKAANAQVSNSDETKITLQPGSCQNTQFPAKTARGDNEKPGPFQYKLSSDGKKMTRILAKTHQK